MADLVVSRALSESDGDAGTVEFIPRGSPTSPHHHPGRKVQHVYIVRDAGQTRQTKQAASHAMTDLSSRYTPLERLAIAWVTSTRPKTVGGNDPDFDHIRSLLAPNAVLRFGHMHFVSTAPHLQRDESPDDFVNRLKSMSPAFQTWRIDVADVNVDTGKNSAVVRAVFHMQAMNDPEVVQNEILFWCQMDDKAEKILQSTEFVDPAALQALGPKLKAARISDGL